MKKFNEISAIAEENNLTVNASTERLTVEAYSPSGELVNISVPIDNENSLILEIADAADNFDEDEYITSHGGNLASLIEDAAIIHEQLMWFARQLRSAWFARHSFSVYA